MKYWQTRVMTSSVDGWRHQICYSTKKFILSWSLFLVYAYLNEGDKKITLKKRGRGSSLFFLFFYPLKKKIGPRFFPFFWKVHFSPFFVEGKVYFGTISRLLIFFSKPFSPFYFYLRTLFFKTPPVIFPPAYFFFLSRTPSRDKF